MRIVNTNNETNNNEVNNRALRKRNKKRSTQTINKKKKMYRNTRARLYRRGVAQKGK